MCNLGIPNSNVSLTSLRLRFVYFIFAFGLMLGRYTHSWYAWDFVINPALLVAKFWWQICCMACIVAGEALSEFLLDAYRVNKEFPLFHSPLNCTYC